MYEVTFKKTGEFTESQMIYKREEAFDLFAGFSGDNSIEYAEVYDVRNSTTLLLLDIHGAYHA